MRSNFLVFRATQGLRAGDWRNLTSMRAVLLMLVLSLVIASLPVSARSKRARQTAHSASASQMSLPATMYNSFRKTVTSVSGWLTGYIKSKPPANTYQPVAAYFTTPPPFIEAPTSLNVTGTSDGSISLSWVGPTGGADHYKVERSASASGPFFFLGITTATTYTDNTATIDHAYLYRVRAVNGTGVPSAPSNMAFGTAISFEFSNLVNRPIRAQHLYDVRTAVNAARAVAGLASVNWARTSLANQKVDKGDISELRTNLDAALVALSIPVLSYDDSILTAGVTLVKAKHIEQLQARSTSGSSTSSGPVDSDSSSARLDPLNATGGGGENPLSRNFNWSLPLVNLPGRSGLDLNLTLSYNSLVWNKIGSSAIVFDEDNGFPGPGFRLGFPVIQQPYYNAEVGKNAFMLIGSDGSRAELRQVAATPTLYEAGNSSHLLLDSETMILRTTEGTQLSYELYDGEFKCTKITDRNGNYLSVSYNSLGQISAVTDTVARVITFNYDSGRLSSVTQQWNQSSTPVTHYWARFEYDETTIDTNFPGLTVFGPADGYNLKNLSRVKLADDSYVDFSYTSWGQLYKISSHAPDHHLLNYRSYNLPQTAAGTQLAHADCPRFTERHDWAQYWNGDTDGTAATNEEVLTQFAVPVGDTWTMPDSSSKTGMRAQVTAADGTLTKIYFIGAPGSSTGWQRGLQALVDTYASGVANPVRRVTTTWTQDAEVSYPLNPRVLETNIYDDVNNHSRTEITYQQFNLADGTSCHLPRDINEYASNGTTLLRSSRTEYNMTATYTNRRILGLASEKLLHEGDGTLRSKVGFFYDESESILGTDAPVQHDTINYSATFVAGRGNLSSVKRYDVVTGAFTTTSAKYNTAGSPVSARNALDHETTILYTDAFSDGVTTRNTLAYPTRVVDPDEFSSTLIYQYDFGGVTRVQSPQPGIATYAPGPEQSTTFDSIGRVQQITNLVNEAYTRFEYSSSGNRVDSYTTRQEGAGESRSFQITDGSGRLVAEATDHPGSSGGYSGKRIEYDVMARPIRISNPTETSAIGAPSQWETTGDDSAAGWIYVQQSYDWKGRRLVTTNQDLTTRTISYSGCGCAGGEVVTVTDEGTIDALGATKKRQQKIYSDVLGRLVKSEILNWQDGAVYSATVNSYNAGDQLTLMRRYAGPENSSTYQDTTFTYDGFGRVKTKHSPENDPNTFTTLTYNNDDSISVITDPRGATSTFQYSNNRGLVNTATYEKSGSPTIVFEYTYDSVGNRLSMTDPSGSTSYVYNSLSQLVSETRQFADLSGQSYTMGYAYNLAGQVKKFTLPSQFGTEVNYQYDRASRLIAVTNTGYTYTDPTNIEQRIEVPLSTFLTNITYRAWNDIKSMEEAQGVQLAYTYNSRLAPVTYSISNLAGNTSMSWEYTYHPDGMINLASDIANSQFDRKYEFDHVGRLSEAYTGNEARGGSASNPPNSPYRQTNTYDAFGNLKQQTGRIWQKNLSGQSFTYSNNRRLGLSYDAIGNVIGDAQGSHLFDAQGQRSKATAGSVGGGDTGNPAMAAEEQTTVYDGAGNPAIVKSTNRVETLVGEGPVTTIATESKTVLYLRSTVLDAVVAQLDSQGVRHREYIYAGGERIALWDITPSNDGIEWQHKNPVTGTWVSVWPPFKTAHRTESDPSGRDTGIEPFFIPADPPEPSATRDTTYLIEGGPTIEAELGMQLYEDRYINKIFDSEQGSGSGPGQGNFGGKDPFEWQKYREYQILSGQRFLYGLDKMDANVPGSDEWVEEFEDIDGGNVWMLGEDGQVTPYATIISVSRGFRLVPGQGKQATQRTRTNTSGEISDPTSKIRIINTGGDTEFEKNELKILRKIEWMVNSGSCNEAFRAWGLATPRDLVNMGLITLSSIRAVTDSSYNQVLGEALGVRGPLPNANRIDILTASGPARTYRNNRTGRSIIFFAADAFQGSYLDEAIPHEFIHAGGQGSKYSVGGWLSRGHDLTGFNPKAYKQIIEKCKDH